VFGSFRTEQGHVDLKRGGLLPLISAARVMALFDGSTALDIRGRRCGALPRSTGRCGTPWRPADRIVAAGGRIR
jgi:hypothetical protein